MEAALGAPPLVAVVLWLTGSWLGCRLPPAAGVRLLTGAAVVVALACGFVLSVAAFLVAAQLPLAAGLGHWRAAAVRTQSTFALAAGLLAGLALVALLGSSLRRVVRAGRDLASAALVCRRLTCTAGGLVIVEDDTPDAYALPGLRGRIVVSTAMLRALPADERRVLLAHEAAHLHHHHALYLQLAELAAAANPLLRPAARAVARGVERWADELAAAEVGDRRLGARALARAALARSAAASRAPAAALAAAGTDVGDRVRALLGAPPRPRRDLAAAVVALVLVSTAASMHAAQLTEHRFERAKAAEAAPR